MHEMSIAQSLVGIVQQEMSKHGVSRLVSVRVCHGALAAVVPHALEFAWQAVTQDTPLAGARLDMVEVAVRLRCSSCGKEFTPEDCDRLLLIPCPACGEDLGHEVLEGKELYIENLEAD
jgi:hydrogenase nickel incorporation protein HypA/HybF